MDSADNIPAIKGIGKVGAAKLLATTTPDQYEQVIKDKYLSIFGASEGVRRFVDTKDLLDMLKTTEDVKKWLNEDLKEINIYECEF